MLSRVVDRPHRPATPGRPFGEFPSIRAAATGEQSIVIGFDTEFAERPGLGRRPDAELRSIVSYQFAAIHPEFPDKLVQVVILPLSDLPADQALPGMRISLERALEIIIERMALHRHPLAPKGHGGWTEKGVPRRLGMVTGDDGSGVWRPSQLFRNSRAAGQTSRALPITLLAHYMPADLTAFANRRLLASALGRDAADRAGFKSRRSVWLDNRAPDILRTVISAGGGMVSPTPVRMTLNGATKYFCRPVELTIRDTMCHTAPGKAKAADLGKIVGVPKLEVPGDWIKHMDEYLRLHWKEFLEYAINDAVIALEFGCSMYGDHRGIPLTLTTVAARAIRETIKCEEGLRSTKEFNLQFAGLTGSSEAVSAIVGVEDQLDYYRKRDLIPLDGAAATWQHACANAFRGGYNSCNEVGYFGRETHDFDLISCYPTSESTLHDVDFLDPAGVIATTINNTTLTLDMLASPLTPFVGFVRFSFPPSVTYPTIPVPLDGSMIFPQSSGAGRGVWASGPEVWLALTLGAEVFCQIGHFGRLRRHQDKTPSRMLRGANRQLVVDRAQAKTQFGKDSLEQLVLKLFSVGGYGKLAQGVMGQRGWDAWAQTREAVGGSAITSPYHAMMTTAIARALLLATMNQLADLGYSTPSCTTDGLITDAPYDVLDGLDLYGLADLWHETRESLTGSPRMWEEKHHQCDLLNFTTRGNLSREPCGVLAHAGYKLPEDVVEDSSEDREFMWRLVVTRENPLPSVFKAFPSVQELTRIERRWDFQSTTVERLMVLEFDRKRRPVPDAMSADLLEVDGKHYEIAHVHTVAWRTPEEALSGRSVDAGLKRWDDDLGEETWVRSPVRKTRDQWFDYYSRLSNLLDEGDASTEAQRLDRIAKGIVIAQRQGLVDIPWLRSGTGNGPLWWRLRLMTFFGLPEVSERYWKHALSSVERQIEVDLDAIAPYVDRMIACDAAYVLTPEDLEPSPLDTDIEELMIP
ncbi:DNA-directed DNA polymerase [Propionibacterium freudenreichii]|uniref:DNA-directed DNA polymerase n=1 Tax=Propionibacterium freudenreichii TaxID=1744 RepID=UPI00254F91EF|nr:DNA-directed DNA polymerase [Propionibacterium freudenreichii]MDK9661429.1 DNA-directed DNA polymerase [Propionibacterium freudenreichii]